MGGCFDLDYWGGGGVVLFVMMMHVMAMMEVMVMTLLGS